MSEGCKRMNRVKLFFSYRYGMIDRILRYKYKIIHHRMKDLAIRGGIRYAIDYVFKYINKLMNKKKLRYFAHFDILVTIALYLSDLGEHTHARDICLKVIQDLPRSSPNYRFKMMWMIAIQIFLLSRSELNSLSIEELNVVSEQAKRFASDLRRVRIYNHLSVHCADLLELLIRFYKQFNLPENARELSTLVTDGKLVPRPVSVDNMTYFQ